MRARTLSLLLLAVVPLPGTAAAQWSLAPEMGFVSFGRSARDTSAGLDLGPSSGTAFGFRVGQQRGRWGITLRLRYGATGLAATDGDLTVIQEHTFKLYDISPVVTWRLARFGPAAMVQAEAGPVLSVWKASSGENRTRGGASAALALHIDMAPRYFVSIRGEGGISPSVFDVVDLPASMVRRMAWRRGMAIAVGRRW
jgi:hypothetical protein